MKIIVTENQLATILSHQGEVDEQEDPVDSQPSSGASDNQSGAQGYPEVTTWSNIVGSKLTRGVANPIGNEPRPDLVNRDGPDNQITEQSRTAPQFPQQYTSTPIVAKRDGAIKDANDLQQEMIRRVTKYTYMKPGDNKTLYAEFTPSTINTVLLDIREVWFSGWGLIAQLVIEVAGAEIGLPIAVQAINVFITLNDIDIFAERGINHNPPDDVTGAWNRFVWLVKNNEDFLRLVEDAAILLTAGIGAALKGGIRGVEDILEFFGKYSKTFESACKWIAEAFGKISTFLSKITALPKMILNWLREKIGFINKIVQFFEELAGSSNKFVRAASKVPAGLTVGAIASLSLTFGKNTLAWLLGSSPEMVASPNQQWLEKFGNVANQLRINANNPAKIDDFIYKTKVLVQFPNVPRNLFKSTSEKYNGERVFMINNQRYVVDATSHNLTKI